jgi:hypothetical protein
MMGNKKGWRASARLLSKICLLAFLIIFMLPCIVKADDAVYSTVGGAWVKVNDSTWTMDKDGDGKTDVTLLKEGDEWKYIFNVADDSSLYYGWEVNPPEGYEVENGYGTKQNPAIGIQYARTDNIDIDGVQNGDYEGGIDTTKVYTVPGASTLNIKMMSDVTDGDYVVLWSGSHTDYTAVNDSDKGIKIVKKNDETYEINDNAVTIGFHSEPGEKKSFGYYAEISGNNNASGLTATNVSTEEPALDVGNLCIKKQVLEADGSPSTDDKIFKFNIELSSDDDKISVMLVNKKNYGDVTIEGGKGSFYLSNGGNVNLTGIPAGVKYHITEDATDGYESVLTNEDGTIQKNKTATVTCTNTRKTQPEVKKQTLTIKKIVKNGDNKDNFTFHISFSNLEKNVKYKYKKGDAETAFASDKDGTADVTFTLADNESVVFEDIPENTKYQVTEDANKYYASYEIADAVKTVQQKNANEQTDQSLSTGTETVDADENAAVTFTNTGKEPDVPKTEKLKIRIKKIWNDNEDAGNTRPGNITVYLMQDENIIKNIELNADNGWEAEIDGLEVLKEDGKTEYKYSVNEENVSGYDSNVVESEETDAAGDGGKVKVFTITNTKTETGSLKVSKTVEGNGADRNKAFKFKVELKNGGNPVSGVYPLDGTAGSKTGTIVFDENGMASFELPDGESIVITGLPVGADYTVTENAYKNYKPSDNGKYNGKIETGKTGEISVVNTYDEKYDISVSKTVKGNQGDKSKNFEFVLKLTGSDGLVVPGSVDIEKNGNFETMKVVDGEVKFTLSHGEKIIFKKLPAGVKYEVTETVTDGYKMTCDNNSGVLRTNANIEFVNTKNVGIPTAAMTNTGIITAIAVCCGGVVIVAIVRAVKKKKK